MENDTVVLPKKVLLFEAIFTPDMEDHSSSMLASF